MIGKLKGIVDSIDEDIVIIDVGGVGYTVFCSARTLGMLIPGTPAQLVIETHVREDHIHLYGFLTDAERDWFRLLSTVQRVGSKVALAILSALTPEQISHAILARDTTAFSRISGIGGKLAERIVAELKDKALKTPTGPMQVAAPAAVASAKKVTKAAAAPVNAAQAALEDTISALTHLGYTRSEAYAAALQASREVEGGAVDELIRLSLKELAR